MDAPDDPTASYNIVVVDESEHQPREDVAHVPSLKTNLAWTLAGNVFYAGSQWGMLIVLAKLGRPEMVGKFALALAITAPVFMFANLELRSVQATDARRQFTFRQYRGLRLFTTAAALLVVFGVIAVGGFDREATAVIAAIAVAKSIEAVSDIYYGLLQQRERLEIVAQSLTLRGLLALAALGAVLVTTGNLVLATSALAGTWAVILVVHDHRRAARIAAAALASAAPWTGERVAAGIRPVSRLALLALPLGFAAMLTSFNANLPRYFVEGTLGSRGLGIFAAMAYFIVAGGTVANAVGQATSPRLARYVAAGDGQAFSTLLVKLVAICVTCGGVAVLVAWVGGAWILAVFYTPEYAKYAAEFTWLIVATGIASLSGFLTHAVTAARYFRAQVAFNLLALVLVTLYCAVLVPRFGLAGACWATCLFYATQATWKLGLISHASSRLGSEDFATAGASPRAGSIPELSRGGGAASRDGGPES